MPAFSQGGWIVARGVRATYRTDSSRAPGNQGEETVPAGCGATPAEEGERPCSVSNCKASLPAFTIVGVSERVKDPGNLRPGEAIVWRGAALVLLLCCLGWTFLSLGFEFGHGHTERPIPEFVGLYLVAWGAFLVAAYRVFRGARHFPLGLILAVALGARLLLLPSNLIQENDVYRYVLDGQILLHGQNPYRYSPLVVDDLVEPPLREEMKTAPAQQVLARIGYPEIPTVYPPAAQLAFAGGALLGGWNWMGQRVVFLSIDLLTVGLLLLLLKLLALPPAWILLYAWNPLVLKEITNSVHLDGLVALFLAVLLSVLVAYGRTGRKYWLWLAGLALGLAVLSKLYPVLLGPACLLYLWRRDGSLKSGAFFSLAAVLTVAAGFFPFVFVGWERLTAGLFRYASEWRMNEGAFSLAAALTDHPRVLAAMLVGGAALLIPWRRGSTSPAELAGDFQWVLLWWFLWLPAAFPWYALPLTALAVVGASRPATRATLVLSGVGVLYYLSFYYEYDSQRFPDFWWTATRSVEHAAVWLSLAVGLALRRGPVAPGARLPDFVSFGRLFQKG